MTISDYISELIVFQTNQDNMFVISDSRYIPIFTLKKCYGKRLKENSRFR